MAVDIKLKKDIPENPTIIEGFPSKGFISTIATKYMIDDLDMEEIGYVRSDKIRSLAVVHRARAMHPIRIYAKGNVVLIFSEITIPIMDVGEFVDAFREWFLKIRPEKVILLAGISGKGTEKEHEIFGVATTPELNELIEKLSVNKIDEGMLAGISSDMLLNCMDDEIPAISLMAETEYTPDPLGAASMLKILDKILNLGIDIDKLVKRGREIEEEIKNITEQLKKGKTKHREMDGFSPMYV